jgi:pimeloyl-ACP methyl ester carboxylesterase
LVLVDPVHEDWWTRAAALIPPERATTAELAALRRYLQSEGGLPEENSEGIDIAASADLVRSTRAPTTQPLIILTAGIPDLLPSGLPDDLRSALAHLLQEELPADLATLSPNSMRLTVPNSGHDIPGSQPTVVAAAIQTLVELDP